MVGAVRSWLGVSVNNDFYARIATYLEFRNVRPEWFENHEGGVEIVLEPDRIHEIETVMSDRYVARGLPREWAEVGLKYRDPYLILVRDAVIFPDGQVGIHHRTLNVNGEPSGAAVMPIVDGKILLLRHYRHPKRAFLWEIPRGSRERGQTPEATARTELAEEVGGDIVTLAPLGLVSGSTGFMGQGVNVFIAQVGRIGEAARGEGITGTRLVTPDEFLDMVKAGEITDAFTLCAFFKARLLGLL